MNYYLVDFENVRADGLKDLKDMQKGDTMIVFYSENCKNITLDILNDIISLNLKYNSFKVKVGTKNALDFQLSSYLGYLIGNNDTTDTYYYIVSNDKGYDCLCSFWKELSVNVKRITTLPDDKTVSTINTKPKATKPSTTTPKKKTSKVKASDMATLEEMKQLLSNDEQPAEVLRIFNQYKTRVSINNGLAKKFKDTKKASSIYKKLKPLLKEKHKS